ncbi:GNAT family N-acetyltransferase [Paenibacillus sp. MWE-103]|uniref:GNAT family N-acetyltransferase n=1 Tax=Paenibacillus artemisiicola TaxID=1172618 RepID=A0ABS3WJ08_9BACL|nr:GNAT family N-acetyltransferase [Paenibacillus artemisiicola]MBO7748228.1 GNAT family N-acetyltransferase [Paenibacillus artemisiicola]
MRLQFDTERLLLRPFEPQDADVVQRLAGEYAVASTTLSLPHPYPDGAADTWIAFRSDAAKHGHGYTFAIVVRSERRLIGCVSLNLASEHRRAELGYWLGSAFWGKGYATEAASRVIRFGFEELNLNRIWGAAMTRNPASSAVLRKSGMRHEGIMKQHIRKWDRFEDVEYFGMTKSDFTQSSSSLET